MFLKITTKKYKGQVHKQASIVKTIREGNKLRQKLIRNLGAIHTIKDENKAKQLIEDYKKGRLLISLEDSNELCFEYGVSFLISNLWKELELNKFFTSGKKYDYNEILSLMISHRLHNYGSCNLSEREAHRWICEEAYTQLPDIELHQLYRILKILYLRKEDLEKHLFSKCQKNGMAILYDLTSSYVEGDYVKSNLVNFGYNRDKKKGKKQIVLGLLLKDGLPIAHKVWRGNTPDKTTLNEAIIQAKSFGITDFIFIADRGLITEKNINFIEEENLQYIIATQRRKGKIVKELMQKEITSEVAKVHFDPKTKRVYYLCFNKYVASAQLSDLEEMRKVLEGKLSKLKDPAEHKVYAMLGKASKYFKFKFKPFSFELNKENFDYEKAIAGKYLLITNNLKLSAEDIDKTYRQLAEIERAFGELKHLENMRPIFHKRDDGIKAHLFLCVLTLFFERLIKKRVDCKNIREVLEEMKKLKVCKAKEHYVRTDITKEQEKIIKSLGFIEPPKVIK